MVNSCFWIVEQLDDPKFPIRIRIEQAGNVLFAFRAKAKWPGAATQVFCLREQAPPTIAGNEIERVEVRHLQKLGAKLSITLDRTREKRCEFLIVQKPRKAGLGPDGKGTYEQVFFRTEQALKNHRSRGRVELPNTSGDLQIVIDTQEKYPWRFPGATIKRKRLDGGDYALVLSDRIVAVVERKTLENLISDLTVYRSVHQRLAELSSYPLAALVIEAQYGDLMVQEKIGNQSPARMQKLMAEMSILHPKIQLVFAGNRALANLWTQRWFEARASEFHQPQLPGVQEASAQYQVHGQNLDTRIRLAALETLPKTFRIKDLQDQFPNLPRDRIKRILNELRLEGRLRLTGRGRGAVWVRP